MRRGDQPRALRLGCCVTGMGAVEERQPVIPISGQATELDLRGFGRHLSACTGHFARVAPHWSCLVVIKGSQSLPCTGQSRDDLSGIATIKQIFEILIIHPKALRSKGSGIQRRLRLLAPLLLQFFQQR